MRAKHRLTIARAGVGLSLDEVAVALRARNVWRVQNIERGRVRATPRERAALAALLGIPEVDLFDREGRAR